jgi:hypothetical protein
MPINVLGLDELSELLTHQSARTAKRWLLSCAAPAAEVVIEAGSQNAPVAPADTRGEHPAGMLKASLDYQTRFDKPQQGEDTRLVVKIGLRNDGASMWYGSLQEFGARSRQGVHWLGRAWESCKDQCLFVFTDKAQAIVDKFSDK